MPADASAGPVLSLAGVTKEFPGVRALDRVSLDVRAGEVHALVGENGAGKSTLLGVLGGVHPAGSFAGELRVDGVPARFRGPADARAAGIAVIHQELSLVKELSVAENVVLGCEPSRRGVVDARAAHARTRAALARVGLDVPTGIAVRELGVGQQQLVEIAKALSQEARVLVLDEPTASLSGTEAARLLAILRELRSKGTACIYVSHRLAEVLSIADRVTVLRDGAVVWSGGAAGLGERDLVRRMVGRDLSTVFPARHAPLGETVLEVERLSSSGEGGGRGARDVSLTVRAGEIVGLFGLVGSGRTELLSALVGAGGARTGGTLRLSGRELLPRSPAEAIAAGIVLAPEDRKRFGLVLPLDLRSNVSLPGLSRLASLSRGGLVDAPAEQSLAAAAVRDLGIRTPSVEQRVSALSGGNQQKVVLAKWRGLKPKVLLLDEPTRGVDVGAKVEIYALVRRLADEGTAVLLASSDLPEVLGLSDRVLVMREGRVAGELQGAGSTEEAAMLLATGTAAGISDTSDTGKGVDR